MHEQDAANGSAHKGVLEAAVQGRRKMLGIPGGQHWVAV